MPESVLLLSLGDSATLGASFGPMPSPKTETPRLVAMIHQPRLTTCTQRSMHMAAKTLQQDSPTYTFTIRQRAALQLLAHTMQYLGGCGGCDDDELLARLAALDLLWEARERILKAAATRRMPHLRRLYSEALQIVWRKPEAGVQ